MTNIIDLDALAPAKVTIKFNGEEIQVDPPTTESVFRLSALAQKLEKADTLPDEEVLTLITSVTEQVHKCIPGLQGKPLNITQLMLLIKIINDMATPPDAQELDKRGISLGDPKAPQDTSA